MTFLDENGLQALWQNIIARIDSSISKVVSIEASDTEPTSDLWIDTSDNGIINIPQIDDTSVNTNDTWSSSKIETMISSMTSIDDSVTNTESTWSSSKINTTITEAVETIKNEWPKAEEASF